MRVPALIIASLLALMALAGGPAKYAFALSLSPSTDGRLFCLFLVGLRESLNNMVAALVFATVQTLIAPCGAARQARNENEGAARAAAA